MSKYDVEVIKKMGALNKELKLLLSTITKLRDRSTGTGVKISEKVQTSAVNQTEEMVVDIVSLEQEYNEKRNELLQQRILLKEKLDMLDGISQMILLENYFNGMTESEIADNYGYCERHVQRKKRKALKLLEKL